MSGSKTAQKKSVSKKETVTKKTTYNACCVYDFTLFDDTSVQNIRKVLTDLCKKYTFQLEKGEKKGTLHYQGRFSLKIKKRKTEIITMLRKLGWQDFRLSITSTENRDNTFYVIKSETKVEGPYSDTDLYVPLDVRNIKTLKPWQDSILNMLKEYNERIVDVIFDETGNIGKTTLIRYMMIYEDAEMLPFCNDYKDIMRMSYDVGPKKIYLIDMPRAINKEKLFQFFAGIETLKSGYQYDDRYKFTRRLFDRPRICVFTNVYPDMKMLSKDMWKLWTIQNDQLIPLNNNAPINDPIKEDIEIANNIEFHSDQESDNENNDFEEEQETEPIIVPQETIKKKQKVVIKRRIM